VTAQNVTILDRMARRTALVVFFDLKKIPINAGNNGIRSFNDQSWAWNIHADMNVGIGLIELFYRSFYIG
jgi:hypothetical protein